MDSTLYGVKFFSLNLIRNYLANACLYSFYPVDTTTAASTSSSQLNNNSPTNHHSVAGNVGSMNESSMKATILQQQYEIKTVLMNWIQANLVLMNNPSVAASDIPSYIINSIASIMSLLLKSTYPEYWNTAFTDMLSIGKQNTYTLNLTLQFLSDIIVDVVEFNEKRSKTEINHNSLIKDTMKSTSVTVDIVDFLYTYIDHLYQQYRGGDRSHMSQVNISIIDKCLHCLSGYMGWVDILIVTRGNILSMLSTLIGERLRD